MLMQFTRVLLGLAIALFHVPLADFLGEQDHALAATFRQHGVPIPGALPRSVSHALFFVLGIGIALLSLARIWLALH